MAFLLWTLLLTRHPASRVAPFSLGIPVVGLLAGVVAAIAASVLSGVVARQVFDLPWRMNWTLAVVGGALRLMGVAPDARLEDSADPLTGVATMVAR